MGLALATGCVADSKEIGSTVGSTAGTSMTSESGESSSSGESGESMSSTSASSDPSTATGSTESSGSTSPDETTTGQLDDCDDAEDQSTCEAIDNEWLTCGWVPTVIVAAGQGCEPVETGFEGECVLTSQADTCTGAEFSTCPDGETRVYFAELGLEIGAIELVAFDSSFECAESAMGFEPCVMIPGNPPTYDPPECGCLCPE